MVDTRPGLRAGSAASGRPRIVILGAGFGGLEAARALARAEADVTLFDRHNHHLFQPSRRQRSRPATSPG